MESVVAEVRELVGLERRRRAVWMIGPPSRPLGLAERPRAVGFAPVDPEPTAVAMALTGPPQVGETEAIAVRKAESFADFRRVDEISFAGSDAGNEERDSFAATVQARFEAYRDRGHQIRFLASVDGREIAAAQVFVGTVGLVIGGSTTVPEAPRARRL